MMHVPCIAMLSYCSPCLRQNWQGLLHMLEFFPITEEGVGVCVCVYMQDWELLSWENKHYKSQIH